MKTPPKILLTSNTCWYLFNFRLPLLLKLKQLGYDVALVAPKDPYVTKLQNEGFLVHNWLLNRRSINPVNELYAIVDLWRIYLREKPDLVHHFTVKACLYGTIAAKIAQVDRVVNAITGLGHVFVGLRRRNRVQRRLLRPIYSLIFNARRSTTVFQNIDDKNQLISLGIADPFSSHLIRGSGVDTSYFHPATDNSGLYGNPVQLLFPSRLLAEKGLRELLVACTSLWSTGYRFRLLVAGSLDDGNRSSLSEPDLYSPFAKEFLHILGHVSDMRALYQKVDIVVLPSWREGLSRALIEAASMERPIVTTDVPGCRDVVDHGKTGLLVPIRDAQAIALALRLFIENPSLARQCGKNARLKVTKEFNTNLVNNATIEQYKKLLEN